jgi:hypothetical protein
MQCLLAGAMEVGFAPPPAYLPVRMYVVTGWRCAATRVYQYVSALRSVSDVFFTTGPGNNATPEPMLSRGRGSGSRSWADAGVIVGAGVAPSAASPRGRRRTWGTREALGLGLGLMVLMALLSLLTVGHVAHRTRHPHQHASDGLGCAPTRVGCCRGRPAPPPEHESTPAATVYHHAHISHMPGLSSHHSLPCRAPLTSPHHLLRTV